MTPQIIDDALATGQRVKGPTLDDINFAYLTALAQTMNPVLPLSRYCNMGNGLKKSVQMNFLRCSTESKFYFKARRRINL